MIQDLITELNKEDFDDAVSQHIAGLIRALTLDLSDGNITKSEYDELMADLAIEQQIVDATHDQAKLQTLYQTAKLIYGLMQS